MLIFSEMWKKLEICLFLTDSPSVSKYRKIEEGSEGHSSIKTAISSFLISTVSIWYLHKNKLSLFVFLFIIVSENCLDEK